MNTKTQTWLERVQGAQSLDELRELLNTIEDLYREDSIDTGQPTCVLAGITENQLCNLPVFGEYDGDTQGIFSWDNERFLVCDNQWQVINRKEFQGE